MAKRQLKPHPVWSDVKAKLAAFDRPGLLDLIKDLYAANKDNQAFLHTRFELGDNALEPYKVTIDRWLWPDVLRNQDTSVAKARQAISNYKKAVNNPAGLAELMVFYCERAAGFGNDIGYGDEGYLTALARMFEQAFITVNTLPADTRYALVARLDRVRTISRDFGHGMDSDMDYVFAKYAKRKS
jgi:hypothetical protein